MTTFAETFTSYPDGQQNVAPPPDSVLSAGFIPAQSGSRGQPLPAQWLNWILQKLFRLANRDKASNSSGVGLFDVPNSAITLHAIDRADTNKYLFAIGFKGDAGVVHSLKVVSSATLTLGTATISGNQPVSGGSDVIIMATSRQIGEI